jgi:hypothetical protein
VDCELDSPRGRVGVVDDVDTPSHARSAGGPRRHCWEYAASTTKSTAQLSACVTLRGQP